MNRQLRVLRNSSLLFGVIFFGRDEVRATEDFQTPPVAKANNAESPNPTRPPYDPTLTRNTMAFWQQKVRSDPEAAIALRSYAEQCLKWARESGDGEFVARAENAARRALKIVPAQNNAPACMVLSRSLLTQHRFREALYFADVAATRNEQANRLRADILCELGRYDEAQEALEKVPHEADDTNWNALQARLLEIKGEPEAALKLWRQAARAANANYDAPAEMVAWYFFRLGNSLAALGRGDEAREQYLHSLEIFPRDYRSLTALARLAACRQDWKGAVAYGEQAAEIVPSFEILALLGDAYTAQGETKKARDQYRLVEATAALARAHGTTDNRLRVLFYLDHNRNLSEALLLARADLLVRKDIYAYDTLAWAYYKNKQFKKAHGAMKNALAFGTRDASLFFHAGVIALSNGDKAGAKNWLQQAMMISPRFHPHAPKEAKALLLKLET